MRSHRLLVAVMALALGLAGSRSARALEDAAPSSSRDARALTPDEAVQRALSRSDEVRAVSLQVEIARTEDTAPILKAPQIQVGHRSLNAIGEQVDPFDDSQVGVAWSPPRLEEMGLSQAIGAKDADADVLTDVDSAAAALAVEVRLLHAKVLSLRDEVALATQRVTLLEKVAALQERRVAEGVATALDTGLTSMELLAARADVADLSGDLARDEQRLARLIGERLPLVLLPPPTPLCALPSSTIDEAIQDARQRSSRLAALGASEDGLRLRETRAWLRAVPWINSLQVGSFMQGTTPEIRARLDIALPLFEPLSPELRVVALERERLTAERRAIERDVEEKLYAAVDRLAGFVRMVEVYSASAASIDEHQAVVERSLAAEVVDTLRVATVQERILNARRQALRSRFKCDEAGIAYLAAAGRALPATTTATTTTATTTTVTTTR